jgi:hypothetical protein
MIRLFIGGNADGDEIEVDPGATAWRVADKTLRLIPADPSLPPDRKPRGSCLYTKRTYRRGSWVIVHYFALDSMSDREAHKRFLELQR